MTQLAQTTPAWLGGRIEPWQLEAAVWFMWHQSTGRPATEVLAPSTWFSTAVVA